MRILRGEYPRFIAMMKPVVNSGIIKLGYGNLELDTSFYSAIPYSHSGKLANTKDLISGLIVPGLKVGPGPAIHPPRQDNPSFTVNSLETTQ
jgi:hypothetical protein